jgi:peptidyl-prolyl cis-trans isomerase C
MKIKSGRWIWALAATSAAVSVAFIALALEKQPSKDTIAVVNGSEITQEDFDREMGRVKRQLLNMGKHLNDSQMPGIKKEVLENLISRELLYQETQQKGIKIDEAAVNEKVMTLKKRFPSEAEFKNALTKANLSEAVIKAQIERGLAIEQLIGTYVAKKVAVSSQEVKDFYENHPSLFKQPEQVRASHILIKIDPQGDEGKRAKAEKKIKEIQQKLQEGEDFATLAKAVSEGPSKAKGGDLGYFSRGHMVKSFEDAAFDLKSNEVSDIVETKFGYHLIKVVDKKPEMTTTFEDAKDKLSQYLKQQKVQKEVSIYVSKLKEKGKVERFLPEGL